MAIEFPYDPANGVMLLGNAAPGVVYVEGVPSNADADGFTGYVIVEQDAESLQGQAKAAAQFRVNPGLIEIPVKSRLSYGGGRERGIVSVVRQNRALVHRQHYLSQYVVGGLVPIPARAVRFQARDFVDEVYLVGPTGANICHDLSGVPTDWWLEVVGASQMRITWSYAYPDPHQLRWEIDV